MLDNSWLNHEEDRGHLYGYDNFSAPRTKLQEIVEQREQDVIIAQAAVSAAELEQIAAEFSKQFGSPRSLVESLDTAETSPWSLALAAEFKRASPSKGDINADLDAAEQALEYSKVGASILSVLTEPKWFKGSLDDLKKVRIRTQEWAKEQGVSRPICLRKDFLIDEYQVLEAVAHGADTVLLMVSILSQTKLRELIACCRKHSIEPLVEVVTAKELEVALKAGAKVIGVNNRNLHTFELDKGRTAEVAKLLSEKQVPFGRQGQTKLLALSGLSTAEDVEQCRQIGCSGVLIGEALMRAPDPGAAILTLMGPTDAEIALPVKPGSVIVKVCGVTRPEDANSAISVGANLIGVIFAKSKRQVTVEKAKAVVELVRRFGERTSSIVSKTGSSEGKSEAFASRCCSFRSACKRTPLVVGVFMDQPLEEVVTATRESGLDAVQLHGKEDVTFIQEIHRRLPGIWVIKVLHVPASAEGGADTDQLKALVTSYGEVCDSLLLDTAVKGSASGGTGETFDWKVAQLAQDLWGVPVIVAGGLNDVNVGSLVESVRPFGVDVSSGIEDEPGVKNTAKTQAYVREAKRV